jgi:uncharacterized metal-binding protein YceD (DUF177 family)
MTFADPISRKVSIAGLPASGAVLRIEADEAERKAIAAAYGLPSVARFIADLRVSPDGRGGARLKGEINAEFERVCILTLENFPVSSREPVEAAFSPGAGQARAEEDVEVEIDMADPPEPVENGMAEIGSVLCEFFALSLDPYPRKPGASFDPPEAADKPDNPFAALARLKDRQ